MKLYLYIFSTEFRILYFIFSVRANQITESLQKEAKALMEEKEKLTATLKHCQGELQKSTHDAQNLRSALDLFHRSKFISYDKFNTCLLSRHLL